MKQVEVVGFFQAITGNKDLGFQASWRQNIAACKKYKCSFCWIFQALRSNNNLNPLCEEQTIIQMCVTDNISFQWAVFRCKQIINGWTGLVQFVNDFFPIDLVNESTDSLKRIKIIHAQDLFCYSIALETWNKVHESHVPFWDTIMVLFCLFWSIKASVLVRWKYMAERSVHSAKKNVPFVFHMRQNFKQVQNDMRVSKWWQHFYCLFS